MTDSLITSTTTLRYQTYCVLGGLQSTNLTQGLGVFRHRVKFLPVKKVNGENTLDPSRTPAIMRVQMRVMREALLGHL